MKRTEIYTAKELAAKAEAALMGMVTPVRDRDRVVFILDYISKVVRSEENGEQIYALATRYIEENTHVCGISTSTLMGMPVVNIIFKDEPDTKFKLDNRNGVLCYVYNFDGPDLSELGYCFFERIEGGFYHRIA